MESRRLLPTTTAMRGNGAELWVELSMVESPSDKS